MGQLKAKLAKLRRELLGPTGGGGGGGGLGFDVARTGIATVGFVGFPSVGKVRRVSYLVGLLKPFRCSCPFAAVDADVQTHRHAFGGVRNRFHHSHDRPGDAQGARCAHTNFGPTCVSLYSSRGDQNLTTLQLGSLKVQTTVEVEVGKVRSITGIHFNHAHA